MFHCALNFAEVVEGDDAISVIAFATKMVSFSLAQKEFSMCNFFHHQSKSSAGSERKHLNMINDAGSHLRPFPI